MVMDMKIIQLDAGLDKIIEPKQNRVRAEFIDKRIENLLGEDNFFFFKIFDTTDKHFKEKDAIEMEEVQRFVNMHKTIGKFYL